MRPPKHLIAFVAQWQDLEHTLTTTTPSNPPNAPLITDSALNPTQPTYSTTHPTLFRERHGWYPYSERVWLALEHKNIPHDTILIDNTGPGARPQYFSGQTPQMRWEDGKNQRESMDLVREVDRRYNNNNDDNGNINVNSLYPTHDEQKVQQTIDKFRNIFPSKSRPSSRAAFLFGWNGEPLWKSEFERVLTETDELLGSNPDGPFFCGASFTAADVAWTPFLERYAAQLPCLHANLQPRNGENYPNLNQWFTAMETKVPAYACRVRGHPSSWRKVLKMAGYGNSGVPPAVMGRMEDLKQLEMEEGRMLNEEERRVEQGLWEEYRKGREYLAGTPSAEAGRILWKNREAIVKDTLKQIKIGNGLDGMGVLSEEASLDEAMRALATVLIYGSENDGYYEELEGASKEAMGVNGVLELASFLDERMCVPRDMGSMSASAIKRVAALPQTR